MFKKNLISLVRGVFYDPTKDNYLFTKSDLQQGPISVGLQVTRRCNLKCIHCAEAEKIKESSIQNIKKIIQQLKKGGVRKICITGGEPLCREDLLEIVKICNLEDLTMTLSTNGQTLTGSFLDKVKDKIANIRFSLHGTEKLHDRIVGKKGAFNKTISAIKLSVKRDIPVGVIFSVLRSNLDQMIDVAKICERLKIDKFIIFTLIARGRARKIFDKEFIHVSEVKNVMEKLLEVKTRENWSLSVNLVDWRIEGQCILVLPDGTMIGTPSFKDRGNTFVLGNILTEDIRKLWAEYPFKGNYLNYYKFH